MELPELQADSVAKICAAKTEAAFRLLGGNVVVQDSSRVQAQDASSMWSLLCVHAGQWLRDRSFEWLPRAVHKVCSLNYWRGRTSETYGWAAEPPMWLCRLRWLRRCSRHLLLTPSVAPLVLVANYWQP